MASLPIPSPAHFRTLGTAAAVAKVPAIEAGEVAFTARLMVLATLPHSDPGEGVKEWGRTNGDFSLGISAGYGKGLPFGSYPRLLLVWLCSEAVRTRSRDIVLGDSLRGFMALLGLTVSGGKRGTVTGLREQMERLFASRVSAIYSGGKGWAFQSVEVVRDSALWWDEKRPDQAGLWESRVKLGERLFAEILAAPVPVDARILRAIKQSPLALDLYTWLTYRVSYLTEPVAISWPQLAEQLGAEYGDRKEFAREVRRQLRRIATLWPGLHYATPRGRLILSPSEPSVPRLRAPR
jgi:hypothetical protein